MYDHRPPVVHEAVEARMCQQAGLMVRLPHTLQGHYDELAVKTTANRQIWFRCLIHSWAIL